MNIFVLSSYNDSWNSVRPEAELIITLSQMGHNITVFTDASAPYVSRFRDIGILVVDIYPKKKICFPTINFLRKYFELNEPDVVYALNSKTIPNAAFSCIGFPKIKLVTYRGTVGGLYRHDPTAYLTHLHPRVDGIVCVADAVRTDVDRAIWSKRVLTATVHKGHDICWYDVNRLDRASLGLSAEDVLLVCIANARPSKGVDVLLKSLRSLAIHPNLHCLLVGRDMETDANIKLASESGMQNRIHFLGYRSDVPELLKACDIHVQPSISGEGLPKTVIEAMASSIPSVVTETGGSKEVIVDNETGFVVSCGSANALAESITELVSSQAKREIMGNRARQRLIDQFSLRATAEKYEEYFLKLINDKVRSN